MAIQPVPIQPTINDFLFGWAFFYAQPPVKGKPGTGPLFARNQTDLGKYVVPQQDREVIQLGMRRDGWPRPHRRRSLRCREVAGLHQHELHQHQLPGPALT